MKIRKGDKVKVISGKNKGKESSVSGVQPKKEKVLVEGVNIVSRHLKKGRRESGGIVKVIRPIHISNVMVVCPKCNKPARIGYKLVDGKKYRFCKKCEGIVSFKVNSKPKVIKK